MNVRCYHFHGSASNLIRSFVICCVLLRYDPSMMYSNHVVQAWTIFTNVNKCTHRYSYDKRRTNPLKHQLNLQHHLLLPQHLSRAVAFALRMVHNIESYDNIMNTDDDAAADDDSIIETTDSSTITSTIEDDDDDDDYHDDVDVQYRKKMEGVWRYNKKPLLSIGAQKGPTIKHGNSLRELLLHHTTVKVKIQLLFNASNRNNDKQYIQDQMIQVYEQLKQYTVQYDTSLQNMELLQVRVNERILLIGLPGTKQRILDGTYPPPPPPQKKDMVDESTTIDK
jgi:hypothetical protein